MKTLKLRIKLLQHGLRSKIYIGETISYYFNVTQGKYFFSTMINGQYHIIEMSDNLNNFHNWADMIDKSYILYKKKQFA